MPRRKTRLHTAVPNPARKPKDRVQKRPVPTPKVTTVQLGQQDKVIERRRFLLQLVRRGITQPDQIVDMYAQKKYDVSERTIRDDRLAVRDMLRELYAHEADDTRLELRAQLEDLEVQFQQIAQQALDPNGKRSYYAAVQALGQKKDTIVSKAKLAGVWIEKTEMSGEILNKNMEVPASKKDTDELKDALSRAGVIVTTTKDAAE